jgi:hypothetical protein
MQENSTVSIMTLIIRGPLFSRYTNAYLGAMVASVADTVFFAPWPLRNM